MDPAAIIETLSTHVPGASYEVGKSVDFATMYVPAGHWFSYLSLSSSSMSSF